MFQLLVNVTIKIIFRLMNTRILQNRESELVSKKNQRELAAAILNFWGEASAQHLYEALHYAGVLWVLISFSAYLGSLGLYFFILWWTFRRSYMKILWGFPLRIVGRNCLLAILLSTVLHNLFILSKRPIIKNKKLNPINKFNKFSLKINLKAIMVPTCRIISIYWL